MRWLLTGYGPFADAPEKNVSETLARASGYDHEVLEVSYEAVDEFVKSLDPNRFDALLAMGHAYKEKKFRIEILGRNEYCAKPDVRQDIRGPAPIREQSEHIPATLWPSDVAEGETDWFTSEDAGGYLCNYILFRALETFPDKRIGFLHLPPPEAMPVEQQLKHLQRLIDKCTKAPN